MTPVTPAFQTISSWRVKDVSMRLFTTMDLPPICLGSPVTSHRQWPRFILEPVSAQSHSGKCHRLISTWSSPSSCCSTPQAATPKWLNSSTPSKQCPSPAAARLSPTVQPRPKSKPDDDFSPQPNQRTSLSLLLKSTHRSFSWCSHSSEHTLRFGFSRNSWLKPAEFPATQFGFTWIRFVSLCKSDSSGFTSTLSCGCRTFHSCTLL